MKCLARSRKKSRNSDMDRVRNSEATISRRSLHVVAHSSRLLMSHTAMTCMKASGVNLRNRVCEVVQADVLSDAYTVPSEKRGGVTLRIFVE